MKKVFAIAISVLAVAGVASAQDEIKPLGLSLKIGTFLPVEADTRSAHTSMFAFGASYELMKFATKSDSYSSGLNFSFDFINRGDYRHLPFLVNYVGTFKSGLYYTAGLGVGSVMRPGGSGTETVTRFAYQAGIGYSFGPTNPSFIELRYIGSQATQVNGVGVFYGYKF